MNLSALAAQLRNGDPLSPARALALAAWPDEALDELLALAGEVTRRVHGRQVSLCAIINARSGRCSEDCRFCAQSSRYATGTAVYPLITPEQALERARRMEAAGAERFALVTSGRGIAGEDFEKVLDIFRLLRAKTGLHLCASLGIIDREQARRLKEAGVSRYHHNLESGRSFFPRICTTHTYDQRVATVRAAREAGLEICCGGIIGLGERLPQRLEMALAVRELGAHSVPVNILNPIPGTPLAEMQPLPLREILKTIAIFRLILPGAVLRLCGGREKGLGEAQPAALKCGINGLMIGSYLTTRGAEIERDLAMLAAVGLQPQKMPLTIIE